MTRLIILLTALLALLISACAKDTQVAINERDEVSPVSSTNIADKKVRTELPQPQSELAKPAHKQNTPALLEAHSSVSRERYSMANAFTHYPPAVQSSPQPNTENYRHRDENRFYTVTEQPVSTFSIDVDTASYANARRMINSGQLPPVDAIRVEEFINYFDYHYPSPNTRQQPFSVSTEIAPSPWHEGRHLLHIGVQGYEVPMKEIPPTNLVFLLDVSGSMSSPNKLPLLKKSLKMLAKQLRAEDRVSIVVYAGASGVVLEPVKGNDTHSIYTALERLQSGGSTNGAAGIELAYSLAQREMIKGGINRVILATDGDFNVGLSNIEALKSLIKKQRQSGIELTTLGFGMGNYNDALMNELAEIGNGNSSYIDNALEANKALVSELTSTLFTIAKDVKIQIEFSSAIAEYRLIGYESRLLNREDFNNDKKDAGEIGAGHSVTALYEVVLADSEAKTVDPLRYDHGQSNEAKTRTNELAHLKLRYKLPGQEKSLLVAQPIYRHEIKPLANSSENFRWSSAVAGFAQRLSNSDWIQDFDYSQILQLAQKARGEDNEGYRAEFIILVKMADTLTETEQPMARIDQDILMEKPVAR